MRSVGFFSGAGAGVAAGGGGAPKLAACSSSESSRGAARRRATGFGGSAPFALILASSGMNSSAVSWPFVGLATDPAAVGLSLKSLSPPPKRLPVKASKKRRRIGVSGRGGRAAKSPEVSTATEPSGRRTVQSDAPPGRPRSGARSDATPPAGSTASS